MMMDDPKVYSGVSRTKESFREEVDINRIVANARRGQAVTHLQKAQPMFTDVSEVGDYKSALDMIRNADAFFQMLPAKARAEFNNDPAEFLDAVDTVDGRARLEAAGLVPPIPVKVPVPQARNERGEFAKDSNKDGVADAATP